MIILYNPFFWNLRSRKSGKVYSPCHFRRIFINLGGTYLLFKISFFLFYIERAVVNISLTHNASVFSKLLHRMRKFLFIYTKNLFLHINLRIISLPIFSLLTYFLYNITSTFNVLSETL